MCSLVLVQGTVYPSVTFARQTQNPPAAAAPAAGSVQDAAKIPNDQLDSLVAPIALYPDPMLSQVLVASTYPLEIVQLQQWLPRNSNLKEAELVDAAKKEDWDPSIQAMVVFPDLVKQLSDNVRWTTDLGNAFLAQQSDVMDAVQRLRKRAKDDGKLQSNENMMVETTTEESETVVVIQPSSPDVVYVPTYNPVAVWGPPPYYPYPPIYYPPYYPGSIWVAFGLGVLVGAIFGGGWGWGCGWGGGEININNNFFSRNNFNNAHIDHHNRGNRGGNRWEHNPRHRGGAPYSNRDVASRYKGNAGDRVGGGDRGSAGTRDRSGNRESGGGDRVGNREISGGKDGLDRSSFGGSSSGDRARSSSSQGFGSMGSRGSSTSRGGGGVSRGGGGMSRGGGGRR